MESERPARNNNLKTFGVSGKYVVIIILSSITDVTKILNHLT